MKLSRILMGLLLLTLVLGIQFSTQAGGKEISYVVVFTGERIPQNAGKLVSAAGGVLVRTLPQIGVATAVSDKPGFASKLKGNKSIFAVGQERFMTLPDDFVAENEILADEPDPAVDIYYDWYQWDIRRVKADQAWEVTSGSHNTVVAVIDTGIAWNHPDLAPNVVFHACYSMQPTCSDYPSLHWHGTHVAGTIAAAFGGGHAVGVGPNLGLASYNVFELYGTSVVAWDGAIWSAMLDAADRGFQVINMSLGSYVIFPAKEAAVWTAWNRVASYVTRMGVTIVASAGNEDLNLNGPVAHVPSDLPDIIAVGATGIRPDPIYPQADAEDVLASYSNYGAAVDLVAPGGDEGPEDAAYPYWYYFVFSTYVYLNSACAATGSCNTGYAWAAGTSMAVPHVAGIAGLLKDLHPELSARQIKAVLKRTAESLDDRQMFGHGMVDASAAVAK